MENIKETESTFDNNINELCKNLAQTWNKPIVLRTQVKELTCGLFQPRTLANLDSRGKGPKKYSCGGKVYYHTVDFLNWLSSKIEEAA